MEMSVNERKKKLYLKIERKIQKKNNEKKKGKMKR